MNETTSPAGVTAIIMAGGEGSRLRPMTCTLPKPMAPILDRPIIEYTLCLLAQHGIRSAIITLQYMPDAIVNALGDAYTAPNGSIVELTYCIENKPLGTAGGVKQACRRLECHTHAPSRLLILSGDGLTDCDLSAALDFHSAHSAKATMVLKRVPSPLEYGVVITDERGRVERFLEKPGWGEVFSDTVNTGIYVIEPEVLARIPDEQSYDFGRDLFPTLVKSGEAVYGWTMSGYWCDIGDLGAYIQASSDALHGMVSIPGMGLPDAQASSAECVNADAIVMPGARVSEGALLEPPCYIGEGAIIESGAVIGAGSVIGRECRVRGQVSVKRSVVLPGSELAAGVQLRGCVVGRGCVLGTGAAAFEQSALGDFAELGEQAQLMPGAKVWPRKHVARGAQVELNLVWGGERGGLFGARGARLTSPQQAALLGQAYASALGIETALVMRASSAAAGVLCQAFESGMCAQGTRVMDAGEGPLPELAMLQRMFLPTGGIYVTSDSVLLHDAYALPITRERERRIEGLYQRQDFARPFARNVALPESISLPSDFYVNRLAEQVCEAFTSDDEPSAQEVFRDAPRALVFTDDPALANLADALLTRLDAAHRILTRDEQHLDRLTNGEVGFVLELSGERLRVLDKQGMLTEQEQIELLTLAALEHGITRLCLPIGSTRAIEDVVRQRSASISYTRSDPADWMRALTELPPEANGDYQLSLHFDALFAMTQILALLSARQLPLRTLTEDYPTVYRRTTSLPIPLHERGRLLRTLTRMEVAADLTDGLFIPAEKSWTWVHADAGQPEMMITAESYSQAETRRLCLEYARRVRNAMDSPQ